MSIVRLITHTPDPEKVVAVAARLCYTKYSIDKVLKTMKPEEVKRSIEMLNEMKHESPIEHCSFTFGISGISRACMAQMTRHRLASFSVKSQRYVSEEKFKYVTVPGMENNEVYKEVMANLHKAYKALKKEGFKNEDARFVLPNACDTQLIVTMNARSLKNFFTLRCCQRAQWEVRDVANKMLKLVKQVAPNLFKDAGPNCVRGPCTEGRYGEDCPNRRKQKTAKSKGKTTPKKQRTNAKYASKEQPILHKESLETGSPVHSVVINDSTIPKVTKF